VTEVAKEREGDSPIVRQNEREERDGKRVRGRER
jgi:hypothetical protein